MIQASTRRFRCLLLGEEPLAAHCAELLMERGHAVIGLVTTSPLLSRWAVAHSVPVVAPADYPAVLETESVELLFSITHPTRITPRNLARATLAAINYHDGPLPRYSGMNVSAWAIANGESQHGVVWHHMVSDIDAGPILERRRFELEARETSISLNMRNVALARESFRALLGRLERGDSRGTPQVTDDAQRTVYARHDRPSALCTVDWQSPAETIDRLIRACDFGNYPNRFGLVKIVQGEHAVGVRQSSLIAAAGPPGTLLAIAAGHLDFACGIGALRLGHFTTLTGGALTAAEAAGALGLAAGDRVRDPLRAVRAPLNRRLAEAEPYFVAALRDGVVPELPFEFTALPVPTEVEVTLPPAFLARFADDRVSACVALYGLVWSCLLRQDVFDLAVVDREARAALAAADSLLAPSAPLRISISPGLGFAPLLAAVAVSWRRLSRAGGFLADLIARHPELVAQERLKKMHLSPLAVMLGDAPLPPGVAIGMEVTDDRVQLLSDGRVEPAVLREVARHLAHVASVVAADRDRPVAGLSLLDALQHQTQIFSWNDTARPFRETLRLQDDFERQADAQPDAVALVCSGRSLSFREVERRANRIAHALEAMGARPGTTVGLMVERGFEMVLAMLGVAKTGAAYVPIEPSFPAERARLILADAGCTVGLVSTSLRARVEGACALLVVDGPEIAVAPDSRPACTATARDACYVIYTSGSTGAPKGVVLCHRAVVNTLEWFNRTFDVGPGDRLLFVTSPSFDLSVYDVFGALGAGASVEIATPELLADPAALSRRLCEPGITMWDSAPPALARLVPFLQEAAGASRSTLRLVTLSGDWIPTSLPSVLQEIFSGVEVHSLGGATEAAIWSNHYPIGRVDPAWRSIPYGTPIQNTRYYVLDQHLRPLPVGMPGDLYIGGVCLAEGYLHRAELTAERFLGDPFLPGQGIYKTGDLARYDSRGILELLGRVDFQVKIRGFRVEVGEIEAAIRASGMVLEAVVVPAVTDASEQKSLVAYVVPDRRVTWQAAALRSLLSRRLPDFMVPAIVIPLEALPLSASGKVDRKALPDPRSLATGGQVTPPRTRLEHSLVQLWQELLHKKPIGLHDDFFALGGHSLLATLLVTRIANRLGVTVPLSQLVMGPTIAQMAEVIEGRRSGKQSAPLYIQCMNLPGEGTPVYMTSGVGGHVFIFQEVAELLGGEHTIHGIRAVGADGECEPRDSLQEVAAIYVRELLAKPPVGPIAIGGYSLGAPVAFELAHQLLDRGVNVLGLIFVDGFAPGYPRKLPLLARLGSHLAELRAASPPRRAVLLRNRAERLVSRLAEKVGVPIFVDKNIGFEHDEELVRAMDPRLKRQLTRLWMKMHAAGDAYRISRSLSLPLLLLKSRTPFVGTADEPTNGWSSGIDGPIDVVTIEGDHEAMIGAPAMRQIAAEIRRWLAVQQQRQPHPRPLRYSKATIVGSGRSSRSSRTSRRS